MREEILKQLKHKHDFGHTENENENRTLKVIILTGITMIVEIATGIMTGSMALLADGWHMGTHAFALGITWFAYVMARRFRESSKFSFGTGKFGILSGYTSALFLGGTAIYMIFESLGRFINPVSIAFNEAIVVSIIGLAINILSIIMLHDDSHGHDHDHSHNHHHDHNLRAAYLHVVADALTSVLAIISLVLGKIYGWAFLDPIMGIVGGVLISKWAWGLLQSSAIILLDGTPSHNTRDDIIQSIESDGESYVSDLHIWPLDSKNHAATLTVVTDGIYTPLDYYERLSKYSNIKHSTIEVHNCLE